MPTITTPDTATAIVWRLIETGISGFFDGEADDWFGDDALAGYRFEASLHFGDLYGEPGMGSVTGEVVVTCPMGGATCFTVDTHGCGTTVVR